MLSEISADKEQVNKTEWNWKERAHTQRAAWELIPAFRTQQIVALITDGNEIKFDSILQLFWGSKFAESV